jgi:hypothetical protein
VITVHVEERLFDEFISEEFGLKVMSLEVFGFFPLESGGSFSS